MSEDQKNPLKDFQDFCGEMPIADLMRKIMDVKKSGPPFNCAEMMSRMMQMCCGAREEKAGAPLRNPKE